MKSKNKKRKIFTVTNITLYLMFLPVFIYYVVFSYIPMAGISIAFMDFRASGFRGWVGFDNFKYIFNLNFFWNAFKNTIVYIVYNYIFSFPAPIILALLLNEVRHSLYKKFVQTVSVMPHFISWVVVSGLFLVLMSPTNGYINEIIKFFGGESVFFWSKGDWFKPLVTMVRVWKGVGYSTIIYLAALSSVDQELYEAAVIDGANRWKQTIHITLTAIKPVVLVVFVLSFSGVLNLFEPVFAFLNDMVILKADSLDTYIFRVGIVNAKFPVAVATGLFKSAIAFVLVILTNLLSKKLTEDGSSVL